MAVRKEAPFSALHTIPEHHSIALLHNHTNKSDGMRTPRDVVDAVDKLSQSLNRRVVMAITDHDTIKGVEEAQKAGEAKGIQVIPGQEVTAKGRFGLDKHILALGIKTPITGGNSPEKTIEDIKKAGGMVIIPHPALFPHGSLMPGEIRRLAQEFTFDGVEVRSQGRGGKHREMRELNQELGGRLGTELGGNDSHFGYLDLTTAFTEIKGDVFEAIKTGATKARRGLPSSVSLLEQFMQHLRADLYLNYRRYIQQDL